MFQAISAMFSCTRSFRSSHIVRHATLRFVCCFFIALTAVGVKSQPNVLFIAVDDLRPELGCFGCEHIHSPHLDTLASRGTVFLNAHCQQAVCSPSRTSLMTGLRPDSTKVWDLNTHFRDHVPDVVTVSQHFKDHGYRSISMGKIYHGGFDDEQSWSEPALKPGTGSRYVLERNLARMDEKKRAARKKGLRGKDLSRASRGPPTESADVEDEKYSDGALATLAVQTMQQLASKDQPFFLAVGFQNPHLPFNSPKKYWELYDPQAIGLAANPFVPKNAYSKALTTFGELRNYEGIPAKGPLDDETSKKLRHGYYAAVSFIDACIGRVLKGLEESGLSENTIVVVWGDHGWKLGEYGCWCKHTNVQLDTRSPLIVVAPQQKSVGDAIASTVEFVDIYPTLCDLAGFDKPQHLEGNSFAELLQTPSYPWKRAAFSQYPRGNVMGYSMTTDRFRYTVWVDQKKDNEVVFAELYDHRKDPQENENVIDSPLYASEIKRLETWHAEGWQGARRALILK
jgi:arylsulfatase A-like enzyme